jgi:hypothetical protein
MKNKAVEAMIRTQFNIPQTDPVTVTFHYFQGGNYHFEVEWVWDGCMNKCVVDLPQLIIESSSKPSHNKSAISYQYHEIYEDALIGGLTIGRLGALRYLLNTDGSPITKGYHEFSMENGRLIGSIGATKEYIDRHTAVVNPDY